MTQSVLASHMVRKDHGPGWLDGSIARAAFVQVNGTMPRIMVCNKVIILGNITLEAGEDIDSTLSFSSSQERIMFVPATAHPVKARVRNKPPR